MRWEKNLLLLTLTRSSHKTNWFEKKIKIYRGVHMCVHMSSRCLTIFHRCRRLMTERVKFLRYKFRSRFAIHLEIAIKNDNFSLSLLAIIWFWFHFATLPYNTLCWLNYACLLCSSYTENELLRQVELKVKIIISRYLIACALSEFVTLAYLFIKRRWMSQ
jgi:hypothetical protein